MYAGRLVPRKRKLESSSDSEDEYESFVRTLKGGSRGKRSKGIACNNVRVRHIDVTPPTRVDTAHKENLSGMRASNAACNATRGSSKDTEPTASSRKGGSAPARNDVLTRPETIEGNAKQWREVYDKVQKNAPVLIVGPHGVGKTAGAEIIRMKLFPCSHGCHHYASESSDASYLETFNMFGFAGRRDKKSAGIVVDDPDSLSPAKKQALLHYASRLPVPEYDVLGDETLNPMPLIVTAESEYSSDLTRKLKKHMHLVKLKELPLQVVRSIACRQVPGFSSIRYGNSVLSGDVRHSLMSARLAVRFHDHKQRTSSGVAGMDSHDDGFPLARRILNGNISISDAPRCLDSFTRGIVSESYMESMASKSSSLDDIAGAADVLCIADMLDAQHMDSTSLVVGAFHRRSRAKPPYFKMSKQLPGRSMTRNRTASSVKKILSLRNDMFKHAAWSCGEKGTLAGYEGRSPKLETAVFEMKVLMSVHPKVRRKFDTSRGDADDSKLLYRILEGCAS